MEKTAIITGASRGIGRACAVTLSRQGFQIAVNYNSSHREALQTVREIEDCGGRALAIRADVSDSAQVNEMVVLCERELGPVSVLINNAGIAEQALFTDITDAMWRRMFAVNVDGAFYCCRAVLPGMIRAKRGSIINISSIWGIAGASCEAHYSAAKAALIGLTKALAKEAGPSGIRVNCISPGVIDTDMNAALSPDDLASIREQTPLCAIGTPDDIAAVAAFLASDAAGFFTGQVISPNGGFVI